MSSRFRRASLLAIRRGAWKHSGSAARALARGRAAMIARNRGQIIARTRRGRRTINQRTSGFVGAAGDAKYVDTALANYVVDTTGSVTHIDIVPQGTTVNQRDGKAFRDTSVTIRGMTYNGSTATYNDCAVLLVWDKQPNKALAAITDVLDAANNSALNKRENASRFVIIRRWNYILTGKGDGSTTSGYARTFDKYVRLPPGCVATCTTADNTGAIGNRVSGALLLLTVGNTAAGNSAAVLSVTVRTNFVDI